MFEPSIGNTPYSQNLEIVKLLSQAKKGISKELSEAESEKKLAELEKQISDLFPKDSLNLKEGHSFEKFAKKVINSKPSLKPHFSELFLQFKPPEEMIDFHLKTLNPAHLKPELTLLLGKVSKNPEIGKLLVDKIDKKFTNVEDKKLAYKCLVSEFKIDSVDKLLSMGSENNQMFATEVALFAASRDGDQVSKDIQKYGIKDEHVRIEIAKIAAAQSSKGISEHIQKYDIKEKEARVEIAKIAVTQNDQHVSNNIDNYFITDSQELMEIAKVAATKPGWKAIFLLDYGITDEKARIEIAKIAAAQGDRRVSKDIQNYGITDEKALVEIAKIEAAQEEGKISREIQNYGIKDEKALVEIAKIAASKSGHDVSLHIKNYGITDNQALVEIAKIAAFQDGYGLSIQIQKYGIKDEKALIEIAKIAAAHGGVSQYIQNFGIKDEKVLIEIAKIAAANGDTISSYIRNYGINDQQALIEIAKIAAPRDSNISFYIQNYGIKDEKVLIEIAKINAARFSAEISEHIQKYGIKDEKALIEIAKIAAESGGSGVSKHIKNYGIKDEKALIEIAKITASGDFQLSQFIKRYGITDKKALIEIAKIAVERHSDFSRYIANFDIEDENERIELAKTAAVKFGLSLSYFIEKYKITDEKVRIEIAKIAAEKHSISSEISNFGIKDEKALIEIAKIRASSKNCDVSDEIQNYGITDEKALIEIAMMEASINGHTVAYNIRNYGIKDKQALASIFLVSNLQNKGRSYLFYEQFPENLINAFKFLNKNQVDLQRVYESLALFASEKQWVLPEQMLDKLKNIQNPEVQKNLSVWFACFLGHCENENVSPESFQFIIQNGLLENVLSFTDPKMRNQLMNSLLKVVTNETTKEYVADVFNLKKPPHTKIPTLLLAKLHTEGVSKEVCNAQFALVSHVTFKQGKNLKVYMNALYAISESGLSVEDKEHLLKTILENSQTSKDNKKTSNIDYKNILSTFRSVKTLHDLGKMSELNNENLEKLSISQVLEGNVKELIPVKERVDFGEKFGQYFGENRVPNFIFTYAAKLQENKDLKECLGGLVDGVLDGKFKEMRYDLGKSEHLTKVFSNNQKLLEKWKAGASGKFGDFLSATDPNVKPTDFHKLLKENLIEKGHLKFENAPLLFEFLNNKGTLENIEAELQQNPEDKILNIQKNTAKLTDQRLTFEEKKELLKVTESNLKEVVVSQPHFSEFHNDIKDVLAGLIKQNAAQANYNRFTITDTDNFEDLFLSGTEVEGSCQKVDGDLQYTKCLMGYVLDGKNRLLTVKDESGRIMARHIFRILLDENDKPVLFMEIIYPKVVAQNLRQGLEAFAKQRAKDLGLPLLAEDPNKPAYGSSIRSISTLSPVPYEYADAGDSGVTEGRFRLANPSVVYTISEATVS